MQRLRPRAYSLVHVLCSSRIRRIAFQARARRRFIEKTAGRPQRCARAKPRAHTLQAHARCVRARAALECPCVLLTLPPLTQVCPVVPRAGTCAPASHQAQTARARGAHAHGSLRGPLHAQAPMAARASADADMRPMRRLAASAACSPRAKPRPHAMHAAHAPRARSACKLRDDAAHHRMLIHRAGFANTAANTSPCTVLAC